jgi:hypothetical protein
MMQPTDSFTRVIFCCHLGASPWCCDVTRHSSKQIPKTSLKVCFPEYDGPDGETRPAIEFIEAKYKAVMEKVSHHSLHFTL